MRRFVCSRLPMRPRIPPALFAACLAFALGAVRLGAQSAPARPTATPQITADQLDVDFSTQEAVYRGHAVAVFGEVRLEADELRWSRATATVVATGHAIAQRGNLRLLADALTYHLRDHSYAVTHLRLGRNPLYFTGRLVEGSADALIFHDAVVSVGEPQAWSPTLTARTLTYFPERERILADHGRVGLGWLPLFPLPATELPTRIPWVDEITVDGGYTGRLGAYLRLGATLPVNQQVRVGADVGLYFKRGVMVGPAFSYDWDDPAADAFARGSFSSGYIYDAGRRLTDLLGEPIPHSRGIVTWSHRQQVNAQLNLHAELNYWSDSEVLRDFRARDFFPVQVPDSFAELTYTGDDTVTGLFLRAQPNRFHAIRQRLPEITFDLLPTPATFGADLGVVQEAHAGLAILHDDAPGAATPTLRATRADLYYALTRPWQPQSWLAFNPVAGARVTHYTRTSTGLGDYTRTLGEVGFDAELRASAVFDYDNARWGIHGLRHLITPQLSYRFIPDADRGVAYIPPIDARVFDTYLEPLGLGARRQIDRLTRTNTLRIGLDQRLQTRDASYGSRDLVALNLALDSRFDRPPSGSTLSDLHTALRVTPAPFIEFALYHRTSPGDWTLRELNSVLTLRSADRWQMQFANHYLAGDIQEYIAGFSYRLNEVFEGYTQLHYDTRRARWVERTVGVRQTLANRWIIGYELSFFEGPRRESDFGFNLVLDAVRF